MHPDKEKEKERKTKKDQEKGESKDKDKNKINSCFNNKNNHNNNNKAKQGRGRGSSGGRKEEGQEERSRVYNKRQSNQKSYVSPQYQPGDDITNYDDDGWFHRKHFNKKSYHNYEKNKSHHNNNIKGDQGQGRGSSGGREGEGRGERSQVYNIRQPKKKSYVSPQYQSRPLPADI